MSEPTPFQKELALLREAGESASAAAREAALRAERLKARRAGLERSGAGSRATARQIAALDREIAALEEKSRAGRAEADATAKRIREALEGFIRPRNVDPLTTIADQTPLLLFPVRLETKFRHGDAGLTLRVRIFPDAINISTHDPLLSEGEIAAGMAYWAERARALGLGEGQRAAELGAWRILAVRFGGPRARYLARMTKPSPWPPAAASAAAASATPEPGDEGTVRLSHSVAPPRACLLPDHFIVIGYDKSGKEAARGIGKPITD